MKKIKIYWFSGTGNSFRVAKIINNTFKNNNCDSRMISMTSAHLMNNYEQYNFHLMCI